MKTRSPGFQPGNIWVICDVCGFAFRKNETKKRWDGVVVCEKDWEPRHPQDFAKGFPDDAVPDSDSRPEVSDVFVPGDPGDGGRSVTGTHGGSV